MPTLLQINTVINSGSTGRIAEEIGQTAIAAGWRSVIAYGRNPRPSQSETIRIGSKFDTYLHALRSRIFDDHGFASRRATENFIRELEKLNPDIVHLHNIHGYYLNIEVLFRHLAKSGIPVVWTLHDCWAMTGHCALYDFIKCDRWQAGCFS
ncbi:MAG: glycosyltransferase, partial [Porphyromonadaceae bacterium]|nr:glycosyltransferase [Porphyromonadaceae bacterium]